MPPRQALATQAWPAGCAEVSVTRMVRVDRMGTESAGLPHRNTLAVVVPVDTRPARVRVALMACRFRSPVSSTVRGPPGHCGVARHDSIQPLAPLPRSAPAPLTILMLTLHGPCHRAAATGGAGGVPPGPAASPHPLPPPRPPTPAL